MSQEELIEQLRQEFQAWFAETHGCTSADLETAYTGHTPDTGMPYQFPEHEMTLIVNCYWDGWKNSRLLAK